MEKNPNEVVLIDPNQKSYSEFLVELFNNKLEEHDSLKSIKLICSGFSNTIYSTSSYEITTPGYSDYSEKDPKPRDCIDIAVKISFELNEQHKLNNHESEQNTIDKISNTPISMPIHDFNKIIIREMHSSSYELRKSFLSL